MNVKKLNRALKKVVASEYPAFKGDGLYCEVSSICYDYDTDSITYQVVFGNGDLDKHKETEILISNKKFNKIKFLQGYFCAAME